MTSSRRRAAATMKGDETAAHVKLLQLETVR